MNRKMRALSFTLLPLLLVACGHGDKGESPRIPIAVRTAIVAASDEPGTVEAAGSLRSGRETILAGKVMGTVIEIRKTAGEAVRQGEVLIVIDSRDVEGQIVQAEGALAQAKAAAALARDEPTCASSSSSRATPPRSSNSTRPAISARRRRGRSRRPRGRVARQAPTAATQRSRPPSTGAWSTVSARSATWRRRGGR